MNGNQYREMSAYFSSTKNKSTTIKALHDVLPLILIIFYPIQLLYLLFKDGFQAGISNTDVLKFALVPLTLFIIITIIRYIFNAKRPYEIYNYEPVVKTSKKGKSFPSRHTASAFIIAMAFLYINTAVGIIMLVISTLIGITRVLSGKHFIKDVVAGAAIGILFGYLGFFVI